MRRNTPIRILIGLLAAAACQAERLPVRIYTTADGLPSLNVNCIVRDSQNFLWFCMSEGLSRFDGNTFTNYGTAQGLPARSVEAFLQTRNGEYWVATARDLLRFHPEKGRSALFERYRPPGDPGQLIAGMSEGSDGRIWVLTTHELFRFDRTQKTFERIALRHRPRQGVWTALFLDTDGSIWVGGELRLAHLLASGRIEDYGLAEGLPRNDVGWFQVNQVMRDREERLWVVAPAGLCRMVPHPAPGKPSVAEIFTARDGLPDGAFFTLFESRDGTFWAGNEHGLGEFVPGHGNTRNRFRSHTAREGFGLTDVDGPSVRSFAEDEQGNLWLSGVGAMRLARVGFTRYTVRDGLQANGIGSIFEDRQGRLVAITANPKPTHLNFFDETRFHPVAPRVPTRVEVTWGNGQVHFEDHTGVWWYAGNYGLCRYSKGKTLEELAHVLPERIYTDRDGLPGNIIFRLFEDSRGDIWISTVGPNVVTRWLRATGRVENFSRAEDGRPLGTPTYFAEDRSGAVWMGFFNGNLARYRDGHFQVFTPAEGWPRGPARALFFDHAGRLWGATAEGGLVRSDNPDAPRPRFRIYTTAAGLGSNFVTCIAEDTSGRIFAGTEHGIDELNPDTGRIQHYTQNDGLGLQGVARAYRDRNGDLWFGGAEGLFRLHPQSEESSESNPSIRITRIAVPGKLQPVSELGESRVTGLRLPWRETPIEIEFATRNFALAETIRFEYRLAGRNWSEPSDLRRASYASLAPGNYTFEVRAINSNGIASQTPASVAFVILPPWWRSWWFLAAVAVLLSLAAVAAHRYRIRQVLAVERLRMRIATDLHDDIGSSLTQISILSELAQRNTNGGRGEIAQPLERIADLSRELVDSMSDIVWAINPQRDHLSDLVYRMRRFASDVFTSRQIEFEFTAPAPEEDIPVSAEVRRQTFLIFKECVNNIVRHAECRRAQIALRTEDHRLVLSVCDDGKGFAAPSNGHGHGLSSIERRAAEIGAHLKLSSAPGQGTSVLLSVRLQAGPLTAEDSHPIG